MERSHQSPQEGTFVGLRPGYEVGLDGDPYVAVIQLEGKQTWFPVKEAGILKPGDSVKLTKIQRPSEHQGRPYIEYKIAPSEI